jgi:glycosyltransferase involved in cell wall biosynthesis
VATEASDKFLPAVVAPTFDNAGTVADIVARIVRHGLTVFVIDDGSTDQTPAVLEAVAREHGVKVIRHPANRGKAAALRTGFEAAAVAGFTHALTIDTDGQLDPEEIPALLDAARQSPRALVIGVRSERAADYPSRSRAGRRVSNLLVRFESGLRVSDSQCGFRVYPLDVVLALDCKAGHFGFETEVITRAGWAGCDVREVPVTCRYFPPEQRVSHFRPWLDSIRAVGMHVRLLARAFSPWPHHKLLVEREETSLWRRLMTWLDPRRAWRELREQPTAPQEMAAALATGVFIGNLPAYGFQTVLSLYAARRFHLNPLAVVVGSHVSTPPIGPVLIAAAIGVGHWLLHGDWLRIPALHQTWRGWLRLSGSLLLDWSIGALLVGTILAACAFVISNAVLLYVATDAGDAAARGR